MFGFFLTFQFWRNPWTKHPHNVKIFWLRYSTQSFVITKPWHCKNGINYSSIITKNFIFGWNMLMKRAERERERERISCRSVALRKILLVEIKFCTWGNGFSINFKWKVKKKTKTHWKNCSFILCFGWTFISIYCVLVNNSGILRNEVGYSIHNGVRYSTLFTD